MRHFRRFWAWVRRLWPRRAPSLPPAEPDLPTVIAPPGRFTVRVYLHTGGTRVVYQGDQGAVAKRIREEYRARGFTATLFDARHGPR